MKAYDFSIAEEQDGLRLDQCLAQLVPELSRRKARIALEVGCVFLARRRVKVASRIVRRGQKLSVHLGAPFAEAITPGFNFESVAPRILFEDPHIIVASKPSGIHSVPTPEGDRGTLLWQLEAQSPRKSALHVVHRLDMPTSGVLLFAKHPRAHKALAETFREHDLVRRYDAFVVGAWPDALKELNDSVQGKSALTKVRVVCRYRNATHLEAQLETGRTHQIRVHAQRAGYPVLGDAQHGARTGFDPPRLALHAQLLELAHPITRAPLSFHEPLPQELADWRDLLQADEPQTGSTPKKA